MPLKLKPLPKKEDLCDGCMEPQSECVCVKPHQCSGRHLLAAPAGPCTAAFVTEKELKKHMKEGVCELPPHSPPPPSTAPKENAWNKPLYKSAGGEVDHRKVGNEHFKKKEYRAALESYAAALAANPKDHLALGNTSSAYYHLQDYVKAVRLVSLQAPAALAA